MGAESLILRTKRLELVAADAETARAELHDRGEFSAILNAQIPAAWPPPLNDDNSAKWFLSYVSSNADAVGWVMWYFLLVGRDGRRLAIGNGGFKGKPNAEGTVEIGYSIMEEHHRRGYAPEAVTALLGWAFSHPAVKKIIAHTLPTLRPSIRVLEKCGFSFVGKGVEEGTIMFDLPRVKWSPLG